MPKIIKDPKDQKAMTLAGRVDYRQYMAMQSHLAENGLTFSQWLRAQIDKLPEVSE